MGSMKKRLDSRETKPSYSVCSQLKNTTTVIVDVTKTDTTPKEKWNKGIARDRWKEGQETLCPSLLG